MSKVNIFKIIIQSKRQKEKSGTYVHTTYSEQNRFNEYELNMGKCVFGENG